MHGDSKIPLPDPIAFFLTWSTYGTWLPGDQRGWVQFHAGSQLPDLAKEIDAPERMSEDACRLDKGERGIVEATIKTHCRVRQSILHAVNCRTNHLHVVVTAEEHPNEVRRQLKGPTSILLARASG